MNKSYAIKLAGHLFLAGIIISFFALLLLDTWAAGGDPTTCPSTQPSTQPSGSGRCNTLTEIMCLGDSSSQCAGIVICCDKNTEQCGLSPYGTGFPECHVRCNSTQIKCSDYLCCDSATQVCDTDEFGDRYCKTTGCAEGNKTTCHGTGDYADEYKCCAPGECETLRNGAPSCKCSPGFSSCYGSGDYDDQKVCCNNTNSYCSQFHSGPYKGEPFCIKKCGENETFCQGTKYLEDRNLCCKPTQDCAKWDRQDLGLDPYCLDKCNPDTEITCQGTAGQGSVQRKCCKKDTQACVIGPYPDYIPSCADK